MLCWFMVSLREIKYEHVLSADISVDSQVPQMQLHWNKDFLKTFYLYNLCHR